jgi:hypothetical protein
MFCVIAKNELTRYKLRGNCPLICCIESTAHTLTHYSTVKLNTLLHLDIRETSHAQKKGLRKNNQQRNDWWAH